MTINGTTFDWEELLLFIEDRRVIPVVGRELLLLPMDGVVVPFERYVARRLAEELQLDAGDLPPEPGLNEVAASYLNRGGLRRKIYSRIKAIVDAQELAVPGPLAKLAAIRDFNLFISTSFDSLLARALVDQRREPRVLSFSTHREIQDLPTGLEGLGVPHVFQIFGQLSTSMDYAVTDEDLLEFLHLLQSESHRPKVLFDEFKQNHLLFLGCGFPDWLTRFFIRTIINEPLFAQRETSEVVADSQVAREGNLSHFLEHCHMVIYVAGDVVEFVDTLHRRWSERHAQRDAGEAAAPAVAGSEMVDDAIFVSYASEDRQAAEKLSGALEGAGLDVWFDRERLEPGDAWDRKIRTNIQRCSLFLPLLSQNARRRLEGYFRREWRWAIERAEGIAESVPFIQPVLVDDLPVGTADVPAEFWQRQSAQLPGGAPTAEFLERVRQTVRELRLRRAGLT